MKKAIFFYFLLMSGLPAAAQHDCGTKHPLVPVFEAAVRQAQRGPQATYPLLMKVFVHVIANDDGSNRAVADTSVLRQLENMRQFFAPHDICFILAGIEQVNSTDLNDHHSGVEEADLTPFLVPDVMNLFIHRILVNDDGSLNGVAYGIPGTKLSVVRSAIESIDNRSTTAHEMGHCFGLYHTFATGFGTERVPRTGTCANCASAGDLLCDTQADPHSDSYDTGNFIDANCNYIGSITQACGGVSYIYNMDPRNIMAYGRRPCRDMFTNGQGNRARIFIEGTGFLTDAIAPDNNNISTSQTISSGIRIFAARNFITVNAAGFTTGNSARVNIVSNSGVDLKPGATLSPTTANGYARVAVSALCQ